MAEKEYYEREAVIEFIRSYRCSTDVAFHMEEHLNEIPTADVIEKLSAKATPKRVGITGCKGCRDTRYKCPICTKYVRNDDKYCRKCGQALMFPIISHTPYEPGKRQEVIISWPYEPPKEG